MFVAQCLKVAALLLVAGATASGAGSLVQDAVPEAEALPVVQLTGMQADSGPVMGDKTQVPGPQVNADGFRDPSWIQEFSSQIEFTATVTQILPDGSRLKKGDLVCTLESSDLMERLAEQAKATSSARSAYNKASRAIDEAERSLSEYVDGIIKQEHDAMTTAIATARSDIRATELRIVRILHVQMQAKHALTVKGESASAADLAAELDVEDRLEAAQRGLSREKMALEEVIAKQKALSAHPSNETIKRLKAEIQKKATDAGATFEAFEVERHKQEYLQRQVERCAIRSPFDGQIVLANDSSRGASGAKLKALSSVKPGQRIFSLLYDVAVVDNIVSVPLNALLTLDGKFCVVAIKTPMGEFYWRRVELGRSKGNFVEIKQGLSSGEVVMLDPFVLVSEHPPF
jgi:HlyD family secretion protein